MECGNRAPAGLCATQAPAGRRQAQSFLPNMGLLPSERTEMNFSGSWMCYCPPLACILRKLAPFQLCQVHGCPREKVPWWCVFDNFPTFAALLFKQRCWGFPGSPEVRTQPFLCRDLGLIPGWGTKIPQTMWHSKKTNKKYPTEILTGSSV